MILNVQCSVNDDGRPIDAQFSGSIVEDNSYFNLANLTYNYADQVNVRAYGAYAVDGLYNQSTFQQMQTWLGIVTSYGVPAQKVVVGVPFSGYHNLLGTASDISQDLPVSNGKSLLNTISSANE